MYIDLVRSLLMLTLPDDVLQQLATRIRALRLERSWKQRTLAERSGVSLPTLQRYEKTGRTSVENLLRLCHALGRLDEFTTLLEPAPASSLEELEARQQGSERTRRKRGSR